MKKTLFLFAFLFAAVFTMRAQDSLQQYVAKYKFPDGSVVTEIEVVVENGVLTINSAMGNNTLEKTKTDEFYLSVYQATVTFVRNEAKKITGVKIETPSLLLEGTRQEPASGPAADMNDLAEPMRFPSTPLPNHW